VRDFPLEAADGGLFLLQEGAMATETRSPVQNLLVMSRGSGRRLQS